MFTFSALWYDFMNKQTSRLVTIPKHLFVLNLIVNKRLIVVDVWFEKWGVLQSYDVFRPIARQKSFDSSVFE